MSDEFKHFAHGARKQRKRTLVGAAVARCGRTAWTPEVPALAIFLGVT